MFKCADLGFQIFELFQLLVQKLLCQGRLLCETAGSIAAGPPAGIKSGNGCLRCAKHDPLSLPLSIMVPYTITGTVAPSSHRSKWNAYRDKSQKKSPSLHSLRSWRIRTPCAGADPKGKETECRAKKSCICVLCDFWAFPAECVSGGRDETMRLS